MTHHDLASVRLKFLAAVIAGQSPVGEDVTEVGSLPFIQGSAEFGHRSPLATKWCDVAPKTAEEGDVLVSVRAPVGDANVADRKIGIGRGVAAVRSHGHIPREYLYWFFASAKDVLRLQATGTTFEAVSSSDISNLRIPVMSESQRLAIASYLDVETARIDALIDAKWRLIGLLGELRNSIASEALEKGINSDVPMQESGVPWLGPVPSHWSVKRLKHVLHGIEQGWSPQCDSRPAEPGEWGVLKAGACNGGRFRVEENKAVLKETTPDPSIEIKSGDLLMSRASGSIDLVGSVAYVDAVPPGLMLSDKIFRLRVDHSLHNSAQWLALIFNTQTQRRQIASFVRGSEGLARNIASTDVKELWIGVPPPSEQLEIVSFVQKKTDQVDELVKHVTQEIELLRELRSTTITDAVLGRIDVRATVKNKKELEAV